MARQERFWPPQCRRCGRLGHNARTHLRLDALVNERARLEVRLAAVAEEITTAQAKIAREPAVAAS